jgi:hypothetical protein
MDPESCKQGDGQINHVLGLGDNDRLPFEAPEPMALLTRVALNAIGLGFAHDQFLGWKHHRVYLPVIRAIARHIPWGQAIDSFFRVA